MVSFFDLQVRLAMPHVHWYVWLGRLSELVLVTVQASARTLLNVSCAHGSLSARVESYKRYTSHLSCCERESFRLHACHFLGTFGKCIGSQLLRRWVCSGPRSTCFHRYSHTLDLRTRGILRSFNDLYRQVPCQDSLIWSRCIREAYTILCTLGCKLVSMFPRLSSNLAPSWS